MPDRQPRGSRRRARRLALQALYQWQIAGHGEDELVAQFSATPDYADSDTDYFSALIRTVIEKAEALEQLIAAHADRDVQQLDPVARSALLIGLAELTELTDVPPKVAINESVDLAKVFGPTDAYRFVNAVLDRVARGQQGSQPQ